MDGRKCFFWNDLSNRDYVTLDSQVLLIITFGQAGAGYFFLFHLKILKHGID